ncbi:hypothetical protein [Halosimplex halobium]|uniref:hypothetical protein n=1 Tax=Halosimplex halobium TaxID=3396618 RepID=UPI003F54665A
MSVEWSTIEQVRVQSERFLPLPANVYEVVGHDHPIKGPSVFWNYEENAGITVLSKDSLQNDRYVDVARTKVYDIDSGETGRGRIRAPSDLDAVLRSKFVEGNVFYHFAHGSMEETENPSMYLLSANQFMSLLPDGVSGAVAEDPKQDDIHDALVQLPAFLPDV